LRQPRIRPDRHKAQGLKPSDASASASASAPPPHRNFPLLIPRTGLTAILTSPRRAPRPHDGTAQAWISTTALTDATAAPRDQPPPNPHHLPPPPGAGATSPPRHPTQPTRRRPQTIPCPAAGDGDPARRTSHPGSPPRAGAPGSGDLLASASGRRTSSLAPSRFIRRLVARAPHPLSRGNHGITYASDAARDLTTFIQRTASIRMRSSLVRRLA
jgi:hypothetical protein